MTLQLGPHAVHGGRRAVLSAALGAAALLVAAPLTAGAASADSGSRGAVFVQLNGVTGNRIAAYQRSATGTLTAAGSYATGGNGGTAVGAPLDALASQSSLVLSERGEALVAVNAGSGTVTSFQAEGAALRRRSVVASGGQFPVSVAVHDGLVYVLNAGGEGSISGYRLREGRLTPIAGSTRSLGLANTTPPTFITAPSQVGFSADGHFLIVATKANNTLLTFAVDGDGRPAATATVTASAGAVPFSFVVDPQGRVHVTEAGTGATSSYAVARNGSLRLLGTSQPTGGRALCWNVRVGKNLYGSNAGSATLSRWAIQQDGTAALTAPIATATAAGPIDLAASGDGRFLYVQEAVAGSVGVFAVAKDGGLNRIQTVGGLPAYGATGGMEGIAVG